MTFGAIPPKQLTAREAADVHGVTPRRIQRLAEDGRIPGAVKKGPIWLVPAGFSVLPPPKRKRALAKIKAGSGL
ncbi:hypothetical protein [Bordetella phage vB_BbrM_PHB04]|uniref:Helix-turn-helix domain-containing protein n=1 Tax=Bordetella phage vB_BbrM_PHB04 TaxID=2029657 RepID=A0A291LA76_9CAUD|nr:hypothetical protein HOS14_gp095 [Bordetella phage vB_BbrM_PHB04]ATI15713.1 hypothetical protein [Bordetella phage vB_BbrM_PHB04]